MTPRAVVQSYIEQGFQVVFWPGTGDWKGPREKDWINKRYTLADYAEGDRVGIMHGVEITPGKFVVDVDVDWGPGVEIAKALLPLTQLIWGRTSKRVSHCLYTTPDVIGMYAYKDVGKDPVTLIEFRSDKHQSMAPPSIWEKDGKKEPLDFVANGQPTFVDSAAKLKQRACLAAIGMLLAKHLGRNGFGHETRLAWAGFLLRAGIGVEDLVVMGNAMSVVCNNTEVGDVRRVIESTVTGLAAKESKKVKGGPALAKIIGEHGKAVINRINEWIGRDSDFIRNQNGMIIARHHGNVMRAIELLDHHLTYDEFAEQMLMNGRPLEDPQWKALYIDIETEHHFQPPQDYFRLVIEDTAHRNKFHPVKQYLDTLTWDNVARIDEWLITSASADDTPYVRAISAIMLIAAVRRIHHPGAKYDEMVVWESPQGMNKSSAAQALCPNPQWFSDDLRLNLHAKELIEATLGKWIIEASDLAGKKKAEIEQLKAMLSRQRDGPARMAYAHFPVQRPRHFIIIGTTNSSAYLTDSTGSRRFWPMAVRRFDIEWITKHRDQLWAEACVREAKGESIRLPEALWPHAGQEQDKRQEIDPWETILRRTLLKITPASDDRRRVATSALWDALNVPSERRDRYGAIRISEIMSRLGFKRTRVRPDGEEVQVGYVQDTEDIELGGEKHVTDVGSRTPGEDDVPF